eukprot:CAMPEP_0115435678 /NCGR_PEP_ID=MMETSP0271-20121206/33789_1 /TAXON_ID=71861 /ORGANISM="Scrippsiella trochoidea, Strain CCMP3099" /LENGTH=143 /DNA_ID=CAMNT_0002861155 /DNA_START=309 /DNA_END=742 /DNA_ORIENTATION=+
MKSIVSAEARLLRLVNTLLEALCLQKASTLASCFSLTIRASSAIRASSSAFMAASSAALSSWVLRSASSASSLIRCNSWAWAVSRSMRALSSAADDAAAPAPPLPGVFDLQPHGVVFLPPPREVFALQPRAGNALQPPAPGRV